MVPIVILGIILIGVIVFTAAAAAAASQLAAAAAAAGLRVDELRNSPLSCKVARRL